MATTPLGTVLDNLRRRVLRHDEAALTDGNLLECFVSRRDEAAFEALLRRHGPMVLGVCRRILRNEADAEDAFQATFLVLVKKAASVRPRGMVGNWLYGVAHSTALKARAMSRRRSAKERAAAVRPRPEADAETRERLHALLDQELKVLPDKYRAAIVLCYLEGKSLKEAAGQLGCPMGTVGTRLARGRALLARRLARRGLTLSAGALATALAPGAASAAMPPALVNSTIKAALLTAAGQAAAAGPVSARVAALTEGMVRTMLLAKLKLTTACALAVCALGFTALWAARPPRPEMEPLKRAPLQIARALPPTKAPKGARKQPQDAWGEPVGGVKIRARAARKEWRTDEKPELILDLHNQKGGELGVARLPHCEIEADGVWYIPALHTQLVAGAYVVRQGEVHERFAVVRLEPDRWVLKSAAKGARGKKEALKKALLAFADPKNRLRLTPGKHTIRVACKINGLVRGPARNSAVPIGMPVSRPVEIAIVDPKKKPRGNN